MVFTQLNLKRFMENQTKRYATFDAPIHLLPKL